MKLPFSYKNTFMVLNFKILGINPKGARVEIYPIKFYSSFMSRTLMLVGNYETSNTALLSPSEWGYKILQHGTQMCLVLATVLVRLDVF
jgi:hypothetical protein